MPPTRRPARFRLSLPRLGRVTAAAAVIVAAWLVEPGVGARAGDACTLAWDGGAGTSSWDDSANWTGDRLPDAGDLACLGSDAVVRFTGSATVGGLRVDGALTVASLGSLVVGGAHESAGSGTIDLGNGRLTVDGDLSVAVFRQSAGTLLGSGTLAAPELAWTGGAQVGSGTTEVTAAGDGLSLSGAVHTLDSSRTLRIDGGASAAWTAGDLELRDRARLENAGLLDVRGDQDMSGCCGDAMTVVNQAGGTIRKSSGDGETRLTYALANDGALDVRTGTLSLSGGSVAGHPSAGTFEVSDDATLAFTGSGFELGPDSVVTGHGSGGLLFKFGVIRFAGAVDAPAVVDGPSAHAFFDAAASLPHLELRRGFLGGSGTIATADFLWAGGVHSGFGATEIVAGGPGLAIEGDVEHGLYQRELRVDDGALASWRQGTIAMTETAAIENAGLFEIGGDLSFGCCDSRPRVHNAPGGTFRKGDGSGRAEIGYRFRNDGTLEATAGTLALTGGLESFEDGTLRGGAYLVRGTLEFPGADVRRNAATLVLDGPDSRIQDQNGADGLRALTANDAAGDLTVTGGRQLASSGTDADLDNAGSVLVGPGSGLTAGGDYRQSGGVTTLTSSRLGATGGDVSIDGGLLRGNGTVDASLRNAGAVQPGAAIGVLTVTGDYRQEAAGALDVEIGGTESGVGHDRLDVTGTATLAGLLRLETVEGFQPGTDDEFELIRHAAVYGEFDEVAGLEPDASHSYQPPSYEPRATWLRRAVAPDARIEDVTLNEGDDGDAQAAFEVTLSATPTRTVRIPWRTADGTATAPGDYAAASGTLTIPHGHDSGRLTVPVHGDTADEPDERFEVRLSEPSNAVLARGSATATILDDDPAEPRRDPPPAGVRDPSPPAPRPSGPAPSTRPAAPGCVDRQAPRTSLRRSRRPVRLKRRRLLVRGTAVDLGCGSVKRVVVWIARARPSRGHGRDRRRRCRFLKRNGRLGRPVSCKRPRWIRARGTAHWRLRMRVRLPRGRYTARSRGYDRAGNGEVELRKRGRRNRNFVAFRVRRPRR